MNSKPASAADSRSVDGLDPDSLYCLAVDQGTGGPKVGLVSLSGHIACEEQSRLETRHLGDGGAVQDAAEWWAVIRDSARGLVTSSDVDPSAIVAVSVTGQWASTVPVDDVGEPVGECILWMDTRGARYSRKVISGSFAGYSARNALTWIRRSGGAPSAHGADPIGHMLYLQRSLPEQAARARYFLEPVDYLSMRFSGRAVATHASMTAAWLTDNRRLHRYEYDPLLLRLSGVDARRLPPLVPIGSVVGPVTDQVALDIGLPAGVRPRVVTGIPDLHSAACGAGAVQEFEAHMAISTTSWIGAPVPFKKTDVLRQVASVPGLSGDRYLIADNHETGGLCLEWLRESVLSTPGEPPPSFEALSEVAASSVPGAGGVIFTPWLNGERSPVDDRNARGGFHNISLSTTRADLTRAVLEGVAYNNKWLHDAVEHFASRRLDPIRIIGGGAQSDLWCQIHADVMERTVERVEEPLHANLRGAAIFAGLSLGLLSDLEVKDLVPVDRTFRPDPGKRDTYRRLFAEFPRLYKALRPMFTRLGTEARKP